MGERAAGEPEVDDEGGAAEGDPEAVDALIDWCRTGPALARVSGVAVREASPTGATAFDVRY